MEQNYKERAARAERVADQMAEAVGYLLMGQPGTAQWDAYWPPRSAAVRAALDQWAAHQADYDTLDAAAAPCGHCGHPSSCTDYDPDPQA